MLMSDTDPVHAELVVLDKPIRPPNTCHVSAQSDSVSWSHIKPKPFVCKVKNEWQMGISPGLTQQADSEYRGLGLIDPTILVPTPELDEECLVTYCPQAIFC